MPYFILLLAILFPWGYGWREAEIDFGKIQTDGSKDSLKERFHKNNLIERGVLILLMAGVFTWALVGMLGFSWWLGLAYFTYCAVVFGYIFTSKLNTLRGLPKWYVSHDPRASKTDKFMVSGSAALGMQPQSFSRLLHTVFLAFGILLLAAVIIWVK